MKSQDRLTMGPERCDQSAEARLSVVGIGGEPIWEACGGGLCVRGRSRRQVRRALGLILANATGCEAAQQKGADQP
jgi:hypothetical protein